MNTVSKKVGKVVAGLALRVAKKSANSTCVVVSHQPKLPTSVEKLRKI